MASSSKMTFTNQAEEVKNGLLEQQKKAMRASAKILKKAARESVRVKTGALKKVIATWVRTDKATGKVYLQLGVYNKQQATKKGLEAAGSRAHWEEFGNSHQSGQSFLKAPTMENVEGIRAAQAEFLPGIENIPRFTDVDEEVE